MAGGSDIRRQSHGLPIATVLALADAEIVVGAFTTL
jgi:hypothetical protein